LACVKLGIENQTAQET